jgi:hypothetical protein
MRIFTYRLKAYSLSMLIRDADFDAKFLKILFIDSARGLVALERNYESSSISWADFAQKFFMNSVWKSS